MRSLSVIFSLVFALLLAAGALAQSKTDGVLSGEITDEFGALTPDVQIVAKSKEGKAFYSKSSPSGIYEFRLPKGIYNLTFKRPPFKTFSVEEYQISDGARMKLDVSLICENCERIDHVVDNKLL